MDAKLEQSFSMKLLGEKKTISHGRQARPFLMKTGENQYFMDAKHEQSFSLKTLGGGGTIFHSTNSIYQSTPWPLPHPSGDSGKS